MRSAGALLVAVVLASLPASSTAEQKKNRYKPGAVKAQWQELVAAGCDLADADVATPIEARLLRNTPFAIAGKIFKAPELTEVFSDDGDWYKPREAPGKLGRADRACVKKLQVWERKLRRQLPISRKVEAVISRDRRVYLDLRAVVPYSKSYGDARSRASGGAYSWEFGFKRGCGKRGKPMCGGYTIDCELDPKTGELTCALVAVG